MLQKIGRSAQSLGAKVLLIIICVVLVVFGFGAFNLFAVSEPLAASVNGQDITVRRYMAEVDREKQRFRERFSGQIDAEILDRLVDRVRILDQLINRELFKQAGEELHLVGSKKRFSQEIRENPVFQEDGEFDPEKLRSVLANAGFSVRGYEQAVNEDSVVNQIVDLIEHTNFITQRELYDAAAIYAQARDIAYLELNVDDFKSEESVTESDLNSYYEFHRTEFKSEENIDFEIVQIDKTMFMKEVELTDEEIQQLYETETRNLQANADRRASHILIKVNEETTVESARDTILGLKQRIEEGKSFEELAKEFSDDVESSLKGGDLGFAGRDAYVPPFAQALFALSVGELSDPIETIFGVHLIRLDEIQEIEQESLEERRDELIAAYQDSEAQVAFEEAVNLMDKLAFEASDSLESIVVELNQETETVNGVTRATRTGVFQSAKVRQALFDTDVVDNGFNSRIAKVSPDSAVVGRMIAKHKSEQLSFDDVKDTIKDTLVLENAELSMSNTASEISEALRKDFDFSGVAESYEVEWQLMESVQQDNADIPSPIKNVAFELSVPSGDEYVLETLSGPGSEYLVVISRVSLGDYEALPESDRDRLTDELDTHYKNQDVAAYIHALRNDASLDIESSVLDLSIEPTE